MWDRSLDAGTRVLLSFAVSLLCVAPIATPQSTDAPPATAVWVDQFGEDGPYERATEVGAAAGSVYTSGATGVGSSFLRRYSETGDLIWALTLETGTDSPPALLATSFGVCVGDMADLDLDTGEEIGQNAGYVRCLEPNGEVLWSDVLTATRPSFPSAEVRAMAASGNALYVAGVVTGALEGCLPNDCQDAGGTDGFLRKYALDGASTTPEWTVQYGTAFGDSFEGLTVDPSGTVRVWGVELDQQSGPPNSTLILRCYTDTGSSCGDDSLFLAQEAPLAGAFGPDAFYLARQLPGIPSGAFSTAVQRLPLTEGVFLTGEVDWEDVLPRASAYKMVADGDRGAVLVGSVPTPLPGQAGAGSTDAFARAYGAEGVSWTLQYGTSSGDDAFGLALDPHSVYLAGQTSGTFEGSSLTGSDVDAFVARLLLVPPQELVDGLIGQIEELVDSGILNDGQGRSLLGKLDLALLMLDAGNPDKAVTMLEALVYQVNAFKNAGILEPELADEIIATAETAIAALSA